MRKEKEITIKDRDKDLTFIIKELPALKAEKWKIRAIMLLLGSDIEMPAGSSIEEGMQSFMAGGAETLFKALSKLDVDKAISLFDEMLFSCVSIKAGNMSTLLNEALIDSNIEDSSTLTKLRFECLKLHFDFLAGADIQFLKEKLNTSPQIKVGV